MDRNKIKYVAVIQCENTKSRCSGFACSNSFFEKSGGFTGYPDNTRFITMTCGGCCGSNIAGRLEHFSGKLDKHTNIKKDEVAIHLASCIVTDNHHHDRCPYVDYMRDIIAKKGYVNIVEGTYQSKMTAKLRKEGKYKTYESVDFE